MPTPEQRFEVPPEYAEVYERAYRRAYEEGQGQLGGGSLGTQPAPSGRASARPSTRGRRIAVPQQRTSRRASPQPRAATSVAPATPPAQPPAGGGPGDRSRRPKRRAQGSTVLPLAGLAALGVLLLVGGFVLGRVTAQVSHESNRAGTAPAASASASQGPSSPSASASPTAPASSGPYHGPMAPVRVDRVRASCRAKPGRDTSGRPVSYRASNVLDGKASTAWRCHGRAIGERLVFTLPRTTGIVRVGLVPGYAKTDPRTHANRYAQNNQITGVTWIFDDGTRVDQAIRGGVRDRSLRVKRISETKTRTVTLLIRSVRVGPRWNTMISTVRLVASARGSY